MHRLPWANWSILLLLAAPSFAGQPPDRAWLGGTAAVVAAGCEAKIVSWNIERGQHLPAVTTAIAGEAPAIVVLQEVDLHARRTGGKHIAEELARDLRMNYAFATEFEELGQREGDVPAYQGQAILTRHPITAPHVLRFRDQASFWTPRWFLPNWRLLQRRIGGRLALAAEIGEAGRRLVVYNVHLESRASAGLRLRQIEEVLAEVQHLPADTPVLVAGDFNTRQSTEPAIRAVLDAGFRKALGGEATSIHGTPLDWIFIKGDVDFADAAILRPVRASDHFPLSTRISWRGPGCPERRSH